jgi:hypothetical protein
VPADHLGDDEQDGPHPGAAGAHGALAAVTGDGRKAGELGGGLGGERADLRQLGHQPGDGAAGDALDGAEGGVEFRPQRVGGDEGRDPGLEIADLAAQHGDDLVDGGQHAGVADQTALAALADAQLGQLPRPAGPGGELLLGVAGRRAGADALGLGIPGDDAGIDAVGLLEQPHRFGEAAHRARIDDRRGGALRPEQAEGQLLVSAGRPRGDQIDRVRAAERGQRRDPLAAARKAPVWPTGVSDAGVQARRGDVNSTNRLCHGNLPCPCDWRSSDCPVVRDTAAAGPTAHPRLSPEVGRAPAAGPLAAQPLPIRCAVVQIQGGGNTSAQRGGYLTPSKNSAIIRHRSRATSVLLRPSVCAAMVRFPPIPLLSPTSPPPSPPQGAERELSTPRSAPAATKSP